MWQCLSDNLRCSTLNFKLKPLDVNWPPGLTAGAPAPGPMSMDMNSTDDSEWDWADHDSLAPALAPSILIDAPSKDAPAPGDAPETFFSTAATLPVVKMSVSLSMWTLETFTEGPQALYKAAIVNDLTQLGYTVAVTITPKAGSVIVDTSILFLDGDTEGANQFAQEIQSTNKQAQLFPAATFGTVSVSGVAVTTAANPNAAKKDKHVGAIVGGVIGGVAGVAILAGVAVYFVRRRQVSLI